MSLGRKGLSSSHTMTDHAEPTTGGRRRTVRRVAAGTALLGGAVEGLESGETGTHVRVRLRPSVPPG